MPCWRTPSPSSSAPSTWGKAAQNLTDLDLALAQPAIPTARRVADALGWAFYPLDEARDVARLVFHPSGNPAGEALVCDVARLRGDSIEADLLARDFTINAMAFELKQPVSRGKWTVELLDTRGGRQDLADGVVRRASPFSLAEDPLRLLRGVRFMAQLGFTIEPETRTQIERMTSTVRLCSAERVRDELWKMLATPRPDWPLAEMHSLGLLRGVLPEVVELDGVAQSFPHHFDVYRHTLRVVHQAARIREWIRGEWVQPQSTWARYASQQGIQPPGASETHRAWQTALEPYRLPLRQHLSGVVNGGRKRLDWLIWHALFHDIAKPATRSTEILPNDSIRYRFLDHENVGAEMTAARLEALRFGRQEIALAKSVVRAHMRPHHLHASFASHRISRRAAYRFFRDAGGVNAGFPNGIDTLMLALADYQSIYREPTPPDWEGYVAHVASLLDFAFADDGLRRVQLEPLLDGRALMQALDLAPGRHIGVLLARLHEAQAAEEIGSADEALSLAAQWVAEMDMGIVDNHV